MSDGRALFGNPHAAIMAAMGTDLTVQRGTAAPVTVRAMVRMEQQVAGQYARFAGGKTQVDFLRAAWIPAQGDLVTVDGVTRPVAAIEQDDGIVVTAVLHG